MAYVKKLVTGVLVLAALSGCAIIPTQSPQETELAIQMDAPDGKGLIYVVRPSAYSASARTSMVYINNYEVGKLGSGHFFAVEVPSGKYKIATEIQKHVATEAISKLSIIGSGLNVVSDALMSDKNGVTIDAVPGEKYYVQLNMGMLGMDIKLTDSSVFEKGTFRNPRLVSVLKLP